MRTICIINHKGGVGKTTTAINLASGLSRKGKRVLLVDLDPQGNVDVSLQIEPPHTLYEVLTGKISIQKCIFNLAKNFDVIPSSETLVKSEYYLARQDSSKLLLKELLSSVGGYDYMLLDCPPSLGILNQNALAFAKEAFVPTSTDFLGVDALKKMVPIISKINETYGNDIKLTKIIPTLFDKRNKICKEMLKKIETDFKSIASTPIRMNSKLKEAPKFGKSIFSYAPSSPGAKDYSALVDEVISMKGIKVDVKEKVEIREAPPLPKLENREAVEW